mmetsp:Transcript_7553/g.28391  ORF Transcript_7553/g.28391 Transcript_7553/m.28391 type:complete len:224 (-) Transcript_7553:231-902(-)
MKRQCGEPLWDSCNYAAVRTPIAHNTCSHQHNNPIFPLFAHSFEMTTLLQLIQSSPERHSPSCFSREHHAAHRRESLVPQDNSSSTQHREYKLLYLRRLLELLISFAQEQYDRFLIGSDLAHYLPFSGLLNSQKSQEFAGHLNKLLALEYSILDEAEALCTCESLKIPKIRLKQRDTCFLLQTRQKVVQELLREIGRFLRSADHIIELEHEYRKRIQILKEFE